MTEDKIKERVEIDYESMTKEELVKKVREYRQHIDNVTIALRKERQTIKDLRNKLDGKGDGETLDLQNQIFILESQLDDVSKKKNDYRSIIKMLTEKNSILKQLNVSLTDEVETLKKIVLNLSESKNGKAG